MCRVGRWGSGSVSCSPTMTHNVRLWEPLVYTISVCPGGVLSLLTTSKQQISVTVCLFTDWLHPKHPWLQHEVHTALYSELWQHGVYSSMIHNNLKDCSNRCHVCGLCDWRRLLGYLVMMMLKYHFKVLVIGYNITSVLRHGRLELFFLNGLIYLPVMLLMSF